MNHNPCPKCGMQGPHKVTGKIPVKIGKMVDHSIQYQCINPECNHEWTHGLIKRKEELEE